MKLISTKFVFAFLIMSMVFYTVDAQTTKKKTTTKKKSAKATTSKITNTQQVDSNLNITVADATVKPPPAPVKDPFPLDSVRPSLRPDAAVERNLVKARTPLPYEHIREDDAWYRERVWREIDIREKMNLSFRYKADEDNGNQRFLNILLKAIKKGDVTVFDANLDDRFTTPLTIEQAGQALSGSKCDTIEVPDYDKDPDGSRGITKPSIVCQEFNPDDVVKFRLKEEWVFDKESSKMYVRILGIAPIKTTINEVTGEVIGEAPMFWVYYPDFRPILALYEVYNGKNFGAKMSWEELFESRYFSSYIIKSSIENPYDYFIKSYIKDDILKLLEGDNIKNKIFNFEQGLWSY